MSVLPFFTSDGAPISRPENLLFASACFPEMSEITALYDAMISTETHSSGTGSKMHSILINGALKRDELARQRSANVVLEIARNRLAFGDWIPIEQALTLAQHGEMKLKGQIKNEHLRGTIRQAFSTYRPICHILAVREYWRDDFLASEGSNVALELSLGRALWFERMLDEYFNQSTSARGWLPLRVPHQIPCAAVHWRDNSFISS